MSDVNEIVNRALMNKKKRLTSLSKAVDETEDTVILLILREVIFAILVSDEKDVMAQSLARKVNSKLGGL